MSSWPPTRCKAATTSCQSEVEPCRHYLPSSRGLSDSNWLKQMSHRGEKKNIMTAANEDAVTTTCHLGFILLFRTGKLDCVSSASKLHVNKDVMWFDTQLATWKCPVKTEIIQLTDWLKVINMAVMCLLHLTIKNHVLLFNKIVRMSMS